MKVGELVKALMKHDPEKEVVVDNVGWPHTITSVDEVEDRVSIQMGEVLP